MKELPGIQKRLEEVGVKPGEQYANARFVNGQTIGDSRDRVISLECLSSERFQSFEKFQTEDRSLDTAAFETSLEGEGRKEIVRAKHIPTGKALSESTGKMLVDFGPAICSACRISDTRIHNFIDRYLGIFINRHRFLAHEDLIFHTYPGQPPRIRDF
ncbi:MAG: hypothetical protein OZ917_00160 [Candidatus Brocadiaceae bacterium]|nr:hypothetical protein [Candidatus Brocadiaceae bacterium]